MHRSCSRYPVHDVRNNSHKFHPFGNQPFQVERCKEFSVANLLFQGVNLIAEPITLLKGVRPL
jgi:hypothetical protein